MRSNFFKPKPQLKWWHTDGTIFDYRYLLKTGRKIHLIAERTNGELIDAEVTLVNRENTAFAVVGKEELMLHPNQWITHQTTGISNFWITDEQLSRTSEVIQEIRNCLEAGKAWEGGEISVRIFGFSNGTKTDFNSRVASKIIPLPKGKYLASDGNRHVILSKKESDEIKIKTAMSKLA